MGNIKVGLYSALDSTNSPSWIIFVGDFVRQGNDWFEVVDCDGSMQFKVTDGRWLWADVGDVDEVLSAHEYHTMMRLSEND